MGAAAPDPQSLGESGEKGSAMTERMIKTPACLERHPGIVFRSGPAGPRAGLIDGPDVWEVARLIPAGGACDNGARASIGDSMGLTAMQVDAALRYHAEHPDEIADWLRRVDAGADAAEAAWRRGRGLPVR